MFTKNALSVLDATMIKHVSGGNGEEKPPTLKFDFQPKPNGIDAQAILAITPHVTLNTGITADHHGIKDRRAGINFIYLFGV